MKIRELRSLGSQTAGLTEYSSMVFHIQVSFRKEYNLQLLSKKSLCYNFFFPRNFSLDFEVARAPWTLMSVAECFLMPMGAA